MEERDRATNGDAKELRTSVTFKEDQSNGELNTSRGSDAGSKRQQPVLRRSISRSGLITWQPPLDLDSTEHEKNKGQNVILMTLAMLGGLTYGYNLSFAGVLSVLQDHFNFSDNQLEWVTSASVAGGLLSFLAGLIVDKFGRINGLLVASFLTVASSITSSLADSMWLLMVSRTINGAGFNTVIFVATLYIAECSPTKTRDMFVVLCSLSLNVGIGVSMCVSLSHNWRLVMGFGATFAFLVFVFTYAFCPESYRWEEEHRKRSLATESYQKYKASMTGESTDRLLDDEMVELAKDGGDFLTQWRSMTYSKLLLGFCLAILSNGANAVLFYGPHIFAIVGFAENDALYVQIGLSVVNVLAVLANVGLMHHWRKARSIFLLSTLLMIIGYFGIAAAILLDDSMSARGFLMALSAVCLLFGFTAGSGSLYYAFVSDIYPQECRGLATGICMFISAGSGLAQSLTFLSLINWLSSGWTFMLYGIVFTVCLGPIVALLPETVDVDIEDIEIRGTDGGKAGNVEKGP